MEVDREGRGLDVPKLGGREEVRKEGNAGVEEKEVKDTGKGLVDGWEVGMRWRL